MKSLHRTLLIAALMVAPAQAKRTKSVKVTGDGVGATRMIALDAAFRDAIGKGLGVQLKSVSSMEEGFSEGGGDDSDYQSFSEKILTKVSGAVRDFQVLKEGPDPLGYRIKIRATVFDPGKDASWTVEKVQALEGKRASLGFRLELPREDAGIVDRIQELMDGAINQQLVDSGMSVFSSHLGRVPQDMDVKIHLDTHLERLSRKVVYGIEVERARGWCVARAVAPDGRMLFTKRYEHELNDRSATGVMDRLATELARKVGDALPRELVQKLVEQAGAGYRLAIHLRGRNIDPKASLELGRFLANAPGLSSVQMRRMDSSETIYDAVSLARTGAFVSAAYADLNRAGYQLRAVGGDALFLSPPSAEAMAAWPSRPLDVVPPSPTTPPLGPVSAGVLDQGGGGGSMAPVIAQPGPQTSPMAVRPGLLNQGNVPGGSGGASNPPVTRPSSAPVLPAQAYGATPAVQPGAQVRPEPAYQPPVARTAGGATSFVTVPAGAKVLVDGVMVGKSPITLEGMSAGTHEVRFALPKYQEASRTFNVSASQGAQVKVNLERAPSYAGVGFLSVNSTPKGAAVFNAAGERLSITPHYKIRLRPGPHSLRFSLAGYQDHHFSVNIQKNENTNYSADLVKIR